MTKKLEFKRKSRKPGENQIIKLSGPPDGLCGYSIVDQSVSKLSNPNGITKAKIHDLLDDFEYEKAQANKDIQECKNPSLLSKGFENLGLTVMSDKYMSETGCDVLIDATQYEEQIINSEAVAFSDNYTDCVECYR